MSTLGWVIFSIIVIVFILIITLKVTKKGYEYKHTIDPLPEKDEDKEKDEMK